LPADSIDLAPPMDAGAGASLHLFRHNKFWLRTTAA
jgi:hypothetical protein